MSKSTVNLSFLDDPNDDLLKPDTGQDIAPPATPWVPPSKRPRRRTFTPGAARALGDVPAWHALAVPNSVQEQRVKLEAAIETLRESTQAVQDLGVDENAERASDRQAVQDAVRAGKPTPKLKHTDWAAEKLARETRHGMAVDEATAAREAYDRAVEAALPQWRKSILDELEPAHRKAAEAWQKAAPALRAWRELIALADEIDRAAKPRSLNWHETTSDQARIGADANRGLRAIDKLVDSTDPILTGEAYKRDDMAPPSWTRRAMSESHSEAAFALLLAIEAAEGWQVTSYTSDYRSHAQPGPDPELADALARRTLNG